MNIASSLPNLASSAFKPLAQGATAPAVSDGGVSPSALCPMDQSRLSPEALAGNCPIGSNISQLLSGLSSAFGPDEAAGEAAPTQGAGSAQESAGQPSQGSCGDLQQKIQKLQKKLKKAQKKGEKEKVQRLQERLQRLTAKLQSQVGQSQPGCGSAAA